MYTYANKKQAITDIKKAAAPKMPSPMRTVSPNITGIPDAMKTRFENLSGFSFDDVRVHYNSGKPAQLQALAYTQGNQVYVAPGQQKHLSHELGHVIQQKQGRVKPTTTISGVALNDDTELENNADEFGEVVQGLRGGNVAIDENPLQLKPAKDVLQRMWDNRPPNPDATVKVNLSSKQASLIIAEAFREKPDDENRVIAYNAYFKLRTFYNDGPRPAIVGGPPRTIVDDKDVDFIEKRIKAIKSTGQSNVKAIGYKFDDLSIFINGYVVNDYGILLSDTIKTYLLKVELQSDAILQNCAMAVRNVIQQFEQAESEYKTFCNNVVGAYRARAVGAENRSAETGYPAATAYVKKRVLKHRNSRINISGINFEVQESLSGGSSGGAVWALHGDIITGASRRARFIWHVK